ncbi:MAG: ankyrin repeat domain-containing protein [Micavibrio sp.]|nr:ankyrin repeat domain-containing protein [Micavibrio sp.]
MLGLSAKEKNAALQQALVKGNEAEVSDALRRGADVNAPLAPEGEFPLLWAIGKYSESEALKFTKLILEHGASVDVINGNKETPLSRSIYRKHFEVFKTLLAAGADIEKPVRQNVSVFHEALTQSNWQVINFMIEKGYTDKLYPQGGLQLLTDMLERDIPEYIVNPIIDKQASVSGEDGGRRTPLFLAAARAKEPIVDRLLARADIDVNIVVSGGRNALHGALSNSSSENASKLADIAVKLINKGIDVAKADDRGLTPLFLAAKNNSIPAVRGILRVAKERGLELALEAPLRIAAENGHQRVVSLLIEAGANINAGDDLGHTAAIKAAINGHENVLKTLVHHKADTELADKNGMIPYDHAIHKAHAAAKDYLTTQRPGYVPPPPPPPPIDPYRFVKGSDTTIDVKEKNGLTMTFNFWTQQLIYRESEKGMAISVVNFADVPRQEAIQEAYEKLKQLGGRPPDPFAVSDFKKPPTMPKP